MSQRHTHALFDTDKVQVCFGKEAKVDFGSQAGLCKFDLLAVDLPVELARHAADVRVNRPSAIRCRSRSAACRQLNIIAAILEPPVIEKILTHLGLQARAPARATARGQALHAARPSRAITVHATRRASQSLRASPDPPQNEPMSSKRRAPKTAVVLPEGATRDPVVVAPAPSRFDRVIARLKTLKGAVVALAGVGAVMGGLVGYWNAYQAARASTQSSSLLALVGTGNAGPLSIVVLPFANLTGDPQQAYLADGLTAAVTADLSRIRDAFIVSPATAFAYKDKPVTVQQIGKELGVRFALQGGVLRNGTKIRINAQLADTTTNAQLWSESFDGDQGDLFALQDSVTTRIGNGIGREMVVVAARESETRKSDPRAVDLMLRVRALGTKPAVTLRNFEEQQAWYRQVLSLEPNNAQAMAGLAVALSRPVDNRLINDWATAKKYVEEARDLTLRAKGIDPGIADIYFALHLLAFRDGNSKEARRVAETLLSLDPKNPDRYSALALDYFYVGAPAQAIDVLTKAIQLDPRNVSGRILLNMGRAQFMSGDDDAAIQWLLKSIDASPDFPQSRPYLAMAYARKGDLIRARAATADMLRARPISRLDNFEVPALDHPDAYLAFWDNELVPAARLAGIPGSTPSETDLFVALRHLYAGAPARAIELFNQGLRADPQHVPRFALLYRGVALLMIGDNDAAIESLRKAVDANPGIPDSHAYLAMAYARKGDLAKMRAAVGDLLRTEPKFSLSKLDDVPTPDSREAYRVMWETKILTAGRLAGLPE